MSTFKPKIEFGKSTVLTSETRCFPDPETPKDPTLQCWRLARSIMMCAICIRECVFNKPNNRFHSYVKWHVRNLPQFDRFYLWMDEICGYGKKMKMEDIWK